MLRFILKRKRRDENSGLQCVSHFTVDCEVRELEEALRQGGYDESGYDIVELIAVELKDVERKVSEKHPTEHELLSSSGRLLYVSDDGHRPRSPSFSVRDAETGESVKVEIDTDDYDEMLRMFGYEELY